HAHVAGVVQIPTGVDEADDGGALPGLRRHRLQRLEVVGHEARLQQQVLRWVPGDRQLGEDGSIGARRLRFLQGAEYPRHVAVQIAHNGVELAGGDTQPRHDVRVPTALRPRMGRSDSYSLVV